MSDPIRIATRTSALARAQAEWVARLLERRTGRRTEVVPVARAAESDAEIGDKERFVSAVDEVLLAGDADLAVHSAKDLPGLRPFELVTVAVPAREDPRDMLCGTIAFSGARVGTSSLRRSAQLLAWRPTLRVVPLRGNVDSRLKRLDTGQVDACVLARAGLSRLGLRTGRPLDPAVFVPAPGQGALAVEVRRDDAESRKLAAVLDDTAAHQQMRVERVVARLLGAGCDSTLGVHARHDDGGLTVTLFAGSPDGACVAHLEVRVRGAVVEMAEQAAAALAVRHPDALRAAGLEFLGVAA